MADVTVVLSADTEKKVDGWASQEEKMGCLPSEHLPGQEKRLRGH